MRRKHILIRTMTLVGVLLIIFGASTALAKKPPPPPQADIVALGEMLYFDEDLSSPSGQACASCHDPQVGFDDPDEGLPVSEGVHAGRFGNRNSPISAYAMYSPNFYFDTLEGLWIGGQFWDGRATGDVLGDPLADQALGPPLNPVEMANQNKDQVVNTIKQSTYADLFKAVWGMDSLEDVEEAYDQMALSIAAFERSQLFAQFNSKYDQYLMECLGYGGKLDDCAKGKGPKAKNAAEVVLTELEWTGLLLFMGENDNDGVLEKHEGAFCSACHLADWTAVADYGLDVISPEWAPEGMVPPLFTDFTYDNLGLPKNFDNPFLYQNPTFNPDGEDFIDLGLGAFYPGEEGKFKVMTLRNIGLSSPYGHNGLFTSLDEIVHFYNTRDVPGAGWAEPEVPATVNFDELGNLGLSEADEAALTAFMETLSDGSGDFE